MSHKRLKKLSEKIKKQKPHQDAHKFSSNNRSDDESQSLEEISILEENTS